MRDARKQEPTPLSKSTNEVRAERPLPLGGGAFASPLAFRPEQETSARKGYGVIAIVLGAGLLSAGIIGLALLMQNQRAEVAASADDVPPATVLTAVPPSEAHATLAAPRLDRAAGATASKTVTAPAPAEPRLQAMPVKAAVPEPVKAAVPEPAERRKRVTRTRTRTAPEAPSLPQTLSRDQVVAAMQKVTPAVNACFGNTHGKAKVSFAVVGKTGRVVGARVTGKTGKVGSCIARAARRARFPKFTKPRLEISYPFAR